MVESQEPGKKIGFGFKKKKDVGKRGVFASDTDDGGKKKDFITAVDKSGVKSLNPELKPTGPLVIPVLDSGWSIQKFKDTQGLPPGAVDSNNQDTADAMDQEKPSVPDGVSAADREAIAALQAEARGEVEKKSDLVIPLDKTGDTQEDELAKLKRDVESRAEEATADDYERVPIADFGAALLRGMGWKDGSGLGKDGNDPQAIEYVRRPERLGLGATARAPQPGDKGYRGDKKYIKPGESREAAPVMEVAPNADGTRRHYRRVGEELVAAKPTKIAKGVYVSVKHGKHKGLFARVEQCDDVAAVIRLELNGEKIPISNSELQIEDERAKKGSASSGSRGGGSRDDSHRRSSGSSSKRGRDRDARDASSKRHKSSSDRRGERRSWLAPHLRVRIVSKSLHNGKYYNKKGTIVDMVTPTLASVRMDDDGAVLDELSASRLETIVPAAGSAVLCVSGRHRGETGTIIEKSNSKGIAVVQLGPDLEVHKIDYDNICATVQDVHN